ncbi:MAG: hypothetical protein BWY79_00114 [Actinobacteria bacterium ADurb.Bin444]|nr:MAG: hypothetical protein BWY79_00114 [Actinobacteria bacterium ADurb.Bin444]
MLVIGHGEIDGREQIGQRTHDEASTEKPPPDEHHAAPRVLFHEHGHRFLHQRRFRLGFGQSLCRRLQHAPQRPRIGAYLLVRRQRGLHGFHQRSRYIRTCFAERGNTPLQLPAHQVRHRPAAKRVGTGQTFVEDQAQSKYVSLGSCFPALRLFGRHVGERPYQLTLLRDRPRILQTGHSEIHDAHVNLFVGREHHVLGLDVSMHHASPVGVLQSAARLHTNLDHLSVREKPPGIRFAQCVPIHELGDQIGAVVTTKDLVHCDDVRMVELCGGLRLSQPPSIHIHGVFDDFDRNQAPHARILGQIDCGISSPAQPLDQTVTIEEKRRLGHFRHGVYLSG